MTEVEREWWKTYRVVLAVLWALPSTEEVCCAEGYKLVASRYHDIAEAAANTAHGPYLELVEELPKDLRQTR